jgi:hypothetical protein
MVKDAEASFRGLAWKHSVEEAVVLPFVFVVPFVFRPWRAGWELSLVLRLGELRQVFGEQELGVRERTA